MMITFIQNQTDDYIIKKVLLTAFSLVTLTQKCMKSMNFFDQKLFLREDQ